MTEVSVPTSGSIDPIGRHNRIGSGIRREDCGRAYADDFVILSRGCAADALAWTKAVMTRIGLTLNEAKTSLKNARRERFDFLGYSFGPYCYKGNGQWYLSAGLSKKSVQRLKAKVANLLAPGNHDPWLDVRDALNAFLFGCPPDSDVAKLVKAIARIDSP